MSAPDGAVPSGTSISRGSKRGACDRCRGQKLRCLREDQGQDSPQATCVRCFKAGATCSFGIPRRAGRPPGSNALPPQERRGNGGGKIKKSGMASRSTVTTGGHGSFFGSKADGGPNRCGTGARGSGRLLEQNAADQESEGETEDTTPLRTLSPSSLHDTSNIMAAVSLDFPAFPTSSTTTLPWPDDTLPSFYNNDAGETAGLEPFGPEYSWAFHQYQAQPMDIQLSTASPISNDERSRDVGVKTYGTPAQTCSTSAQICGTSDEAMDLDLPSRSAHSATFNPTEALNARPGRARDATRERARAPATFGVSSIAKASLFEDWTEKEFGAKLDEGALSVSQIQHRRMQDLSELAMDLYAQLVANDPENHQEPTSGTAATAFQDQLVGSVLKSSNTFLTLLTSFSAPSTNASSPFPPLPPTPSSISHKNSTCNSSDSGASPSASTLDYDDHASDEPTLRKLPAGGSDDSKPPPSTDMTTVLQLLTCYIRIIHLHSIMHARILDYLPAFLPHSTPHVDPVPPIFPGMQVGGVSLDKFGTFQVKMLLQISMHVLGEIELALGLPEGYRVGKKKGGGKGVLEASVSGGFVKCLMSEGAWRGKRVESVREQLRKLRRVLKSAVNS